MEPAAIFLVSVPFAAIGAWVFFNPEKLWEWEPGFRNVELNDVGRARERIGGLLLIFCSLVMVVLGADAVHILGLFGVVVLSVYWFS